MKKTMKKTMKNMLSMAAAVLTATIMTACAGSDDTFADPPQQPENQSKTITLTTTVGLCGANGGATTRALTSGGVKTFAEGDRMAVIYKNTSGQTVKAVSEALKAEDITTTGEPLTDKKNATFTVTLDDPDSNAPIRYIYPAAMAKENVATDAAIDDAGTVDLTNLNAQDGTIGSLGSALDLCTYDAANWTSGELPVGATLANQLAVLAVTVKDAGGAYDITSGIKGLTVSDGTNSYTVTREAAEGPIYVAMLPTANADITVTATDGLINYEKTLADKKTYEASNFYNVGWRMMPTKTTPLTMEALTGGTIRVFDPQYGMKYSKNGGAKAAVTSDAISVSAGDKVHFYGDGTSITCYEGTSIAGGTADVKVYGNIMSLVNETGYATATTLPANYTFMFLFEGNDKLKDASSLLLPATTLAKECYGRMFSGCRSLETAPALPATTLAESCYYSMFYGCTSLTAAPALPATTLAYECYFGMFDGCTSLTTAPALPATKLADYCYYNMFSGCSSLTAAPALPAETLAESCYQYMFDGCTKLNAVTCLAYDIRATDCTTNWLYNAGTAVTGTKTFTTPSLTNWSTGPSGIPEGWTRVDY